MITFSPTLKDIQNSPDKYFSTKEVGDALLLSSNTVWHWIHNKQLPAIRVGNYFIIKGSDVINYLSRFNG